MLLRESASLAAPLRPYVRAIWYADSAGASPAQPARERVLPTATMTLAFRLSGDSLHLFDADTDASGRTLGHSIVGGVHTRYYVRDVSTRTVSVGAQLNPGAASVLLGIPAGDLAEQHTPLGDLWGPLAERTRERLALAGSPERTLALFETVLMSRLSTIRAVHPAVAHALGRFERISNIDQIVRETGYSNRRFIELFREAVGLTPKVYERILRFQGAIEQLAKEPALSFAQIAATSGYSDQSHLIREVEAFAGVTPGAYRRIGPVNKNHVPVLDEIEPRLKSGGKYEMATLELREGMTIRPATVRRLTQEAIALNKTVGDPTRVTTPARKKA